MVKERVCAGCGLCVANGGSRCSRRSPDLDQISGQTDKKAVGEVAKRVTSTHNERKKERKRQSIERADHGSKQMTERGHE